MKCGSFCQKCVVCQDRCSLMAVVSQDRFHCTTSKTLLTMAPGSHSCPCSCCVNATATHTGYTVSLVSLADSCIITQNGRATVDNPSPHFFFGSRSVYTYVQERDIIQTTAVPSPCFFFGSCRVYIYVKESKNFQKVTKTLVESSTVCLLASITSLCCGYLSPDAAFASS